MREESNQQLIDLGDAVAETKGAAPPGQIDPLGGFRQVTGLDADD